jgi:hypothetical protein
VQTEKVVKALYVRKLFLWPRFQMSVKEALEERVTTPADVGLLFLCCLHCMLATGTMVALVACVHTGLSYMSQRELTSILTCCSWWSLHCP